MSNEAMGLIIIYAVMEYIEYSHQSGKNLREILHTNFLLYQYSAIRYFAIHSTFFFLLYLFASSGFENFWFMSALLLKGFDVGLKLYVIGKIQVDGDRAINNFLGDDDLPLNSSMKLVSSLMYLSLVMIGFL